MEEIEMNQLPPLKAWIVAVLFRDPDKLAGIISANAIMAPDAHTAASMYASRVVQQNGLTIPLDSVMVDELRPEFMRSALNGGRDGQVVPLQVVQAGEPAAEPEKVETPDGAA
jgi:hypothetical protein